MSAEPMIFYAAFRRGELLPESLRDTWEQVHLHLEAVFAQEIRAKMHFKCSLLEAHGIEIARVKIERIGL